MSSVLDLFLHHHDFQLHEFLLLENVLDCLACRVVTGTARPGSEDIRIAQVDPLDIKSGSICRSKFSLLPVDEFLARACHSLHLEPLFNICCSLLCRMMVVILYGELALNAPELEVEERVEQKKEHRK